MEREGITERDIAETQYLGAYRDVFDAGGEQ
jgi:hypothetical protein